MGGKESKHFPISYDEAVKRVSETEKRRLQDAFRRSAGTSSSISKQVEILSETKNSTNTSFTCRPSSWRCWGSPSPAAWPSRSSAWREEGEEWPSESCWLSWSSSLAGPGRRSSNVSLTSSEASQTNPVIAVVFGLLAGETAASLERSEVSRFLLETDGPVLPTSLSLLFSDGDRVSFDQFSAWLEKNNEVGSSEAW